MWNQIRVPAHPRARSPRAEPGTLLPLLAFEAAQEPQGRTRPRKSPHPRRSPAVLPALAARAAGTTPLLRGKRGSSHRAGC